MSWFSRLFRSKNMDVEFRDIDGTVTTRRVSKRAFLPMMDKMVATGIAKKVDLCVAHIHDVMRGEYTAEWIVDDDIPRDTYERFAVDGHVYVAIFYENGQPETRIVKKELWERVLASFNGAS